MSCSQQAAVKPYAPQSNERLLDEIQFLQNENTKLRIQNKKLQIGKLVDKLLNCYLKIWDEKVQEVNRKFEDENGNFRDENSKLRIQNEKLLDQNAKLRDETEELRDNINDLIKCQICYERFQSTGERVACKLECPHIMCKKCAEEWLKNVSLYYLSKV